MVFHSTLSEDSRWPEIINVLLFPEKKKSVYIYIYLSSTELSITGMFSWCRCWVGFFSPFYIIQFRYNSAFFVKEFHFGVVFVVFLTYSLN